MFTRQQVRDHLNAPKQIAGVDFKPAAKKRALPKCLKIRPGRLHHTDLLNAGGDYRVMLLWRDGETRERRAFYGHLWLETHKGLVPVARLDYHPSHKDLHIVLNCQDERDLTNRGLPGCKELALKPKHKLDPAQELDRQSLVTAAMQCFNISFAAKPDELL